MTGFAILIIIFGIGVLLTGLYLLKGSKGQFTQLLLWKSNVQKMKKEDIIYAGKVTIVVALAIVISGIVAFFFNEDSIIPLIILMVLAVSSLIVSIKVFKVK